MDYRDVIYAAYRSGRLAAPFPDIEQEYAKRVHYFRRMIRMALPAPRTARILELGCGPGLLLRALKDAGYTCLTGVEISAQQAQLARRVPGLTLYTADIREFLRTAPAEFFDVVVAFDVLEHFTKDELIQILSDIHRVICRGGRLIAHVPNGEGPFGARIFFGDFTHQTGWTRVSASQAVAAAGFVAFRAYEDTPAVHGPASLLRAVLWRVVRTLFRCMLAIETGETSRGVILSQNMLFVCERE